MRHVSRVSVAAWSVVVVCLATAVLVLAGCGSSTSGGGVPSAPSVSPTSGGATVTIKGFAFTPLTVTIKPGQTVTWRNDDSVGHDATGDSFTSGTIDPGASYTRTFDTPGTFTYVCKRHPSMAPGTVVVE